jgi:hypothetical protein
MRWEEEIRLLHVDLRAFSSWSAVMGKIQRWTFRLSSGLAAGYVGSSVAISYL